MCQQIEFVQNPAHVQRNGSSVTMCSDKYVVEKTSRATSAFDSCSSASISRSKLPCMPCQNASTSGRWSGYTNLNASSCHSGFARDSMPVVRSVPSVAIDVLGKNHAWGAVRYSLGKTKSEVWANVSLGKWSLGKRSLGKRKFGQTKFGQTEVWANEAWANAVWANAVWDLLANAL